MVLKISFSKDNLYTLAFKMNAYQKYGFIPYEIIYESDFRQYDHPNCKIEEAQATNLLKGYVFY